MDGKIVMEYSEPQYDERTRTARTGRQTGKMISGGTISLQSESHPVEFRKVELVKLKE